MTMREIEPTDAATPEPKGRRVSLDEDRRNMALGHALQGANANMNAEGVVTRAKVFEAYLKSGA